MNSDGCASAAPVDRPRRADRVCVAIPTYRRPELLRNLLGGIAQLCVPVDTLVEVIVLDNDSTPSARSLVGDVRANSPFPLSYEHVREGGLSSVRNVALARARQDFDFLAMIDDDERPHPQWLAELMRVQRETHADGVFGPVPCLAPNDAPRWLEAGNFFDLPVYADGAPIADGYSGNCLLRVSSIDRLGIGFDVALNFAGGEDLLFFRGWQQRGAKLVFAARAVADEIISRDRFTSHYLLKLHFRRGNTLAMCDRRLKERPEMLAVRGLKAGARIARGMVTLVPLTLLRGRAGGLAALCDVSNGLGGAAGLFGYTFKAYSRTDA